MTFLEFANVFGNERIIDIRNVCTYFNGLDRRRLYEWQKRGLIVKVANNFYVMAGKSLDSEGLKTIACRIHVPAYVGLESALSWYNFIPEAVFQTTAITTRRNKFIATAMGDFRYRSIKPELFFGISVVARDNNHFSISDPEKTLLDLLYFTPNSDSKETLAELRLNVDEIRRMVDRRKLQNYLGLFASSKMNRAVRYLMEMIYGES
jgi:predicted transcriptional regulator of viral defense system